MRRTVNPVSTPAGVAAIPVAGTATVYTQSFPLFDTELFGFTVKAAGAGVKDVLVELEESSTPPTTEGLVNGNCVVPEGLPDVANVVDTDLHITEVTPILRMYGRFKLTGQGNNNAATTITINVAK